MKNINPARTHWKSREVKERLVALSMKLGPSSRLPNTTELCETLSISPTTLNNVLREMEAEQLIDRRRGVGIYVAAGIGDRIQRQICLLCDASFFRSAGHSPFWDILLDETRVRVQSNESFSFHVLDSFAEKWPPLSDELAQSLRAGRVHGMLGIGLSEESVNWILGECAPQLPLVCFAGKGSWRVVLDADVAIQMSVAELAAQGCRRIAYWAPVPPMRVLNETAAIIASHRRVFRQALQSQNLTPDESLILSQVNLDEERGKFTPNISLQEQGFRLAQRVFSGAAQSWPDGIVIPDDMMTRGALVALRQLELQAGRDVRIATHSNRGSDVLMGHESEVTRLEFDPAQVAREMFSMLSQLMGGETPSQTTVFIRPEILG